GWAPLTGVVAGRDKYIDLPLPERYDLSADRAEATNLYGQSADRDRVLAAALKSFNASLPGTRKPEDPDALARLHALGDTSGSALIKAKYPDADDPKRLADLDRLMHQAVEAYSSRRSDAAIGLYRDIIARRPDMAIAYRHLAFVEWMRGNLPGAIAVLEQAL